MSAEHITLYDPANVKEGRKAVFGRGRRESRDPATRAGLRPHAGTSNESLLGFRRTDRDRLSPSSVVTGALMGDPIGDRLERDRAARIRLGIIAEDGASIVPSVLAVLRALSVQQLNGTDLHKALGISRDASDRRAKAAMSSGYVEKEGRGNKCTFRLTEDGRAALEAQPQ